MLSFYAKFDQVHLLLCILEWEVNFTPTPPIKIFVAIASKIEHPRYRNDLANNVVSLEC